MGDGFIRRLFRMSASSPRALWTGSIRFGLIAIPIKLYRGTVPRVGIPADYLHEKDLAPIRYERVCSAEEIQVSPDEVVKGYEYAPGEYAVLTQEDLNRVHAKRRKTMDIVQCFDPREMDSLFIDTPYHLAPATAGAAGYHLLRMALMETGLQGIVRYVLRGKEHMGMLRAQEGILLLHRLRYPSELADVSSLDIPDVSVEADVLEEAKDLVLHLARPLRMDDFSDTYAQELQHVIAEKVRGKRRRATIEPAEPAPTPPREWKKLLRASIDRAPRYRAKRKKGDAVPRSSPEHSIAAGSAAPPGRHG